MGSSTNNWKPSDATGLRIFVVENHADTREFLTYLLRDLGHTVIVADTMIRALRDVPAANCDVLISDIGLPDGDGWELLARLDLPQPIYAVAMSGYGTTSDRIRSKAAGFRHHLVKPMGLEQLESILREAASEIKGAQSDRGERSPFLVNTSPV
ncbi:MAG: response regulator [Burkholderiaceae bacterium]|nr:response regulator [Burkholderiaceae bacterium]